MLILRHSFLGITCAVILFCKSWLIKNSASLSLAKETKSAFYPVQLNVNGADLMENTILVTLSRQITLQRKMEVIANNMANMNTAGFKSDELKFEEYLTRVASVEGFQGTDKQVKFVIDPHMVRNLSQGAQRQTGRELDVALGGEGWMVVNTPQGERFTRNGQLKLSGDGTLVTSEGYRVQGVGGDITFEPGETAIVIGKDGTISTSQGVTKVSCASPNLKILN